jgi:hypothetical protein
LYKDILKDRTGDGGYEGGGIEEEMNRNIDKREDDKASDLEDEQEQDKWDAPDYQGTEDAGPAPEQKKKGKGPASGDEIGPYEYQDRQVDEWDPDASEEETDEYRRGERTRQVKKDYKRKRDAGKAKAPKAKSKKKKKKAKSSLAPQLTWGKIVQDRVQDQRLDCGDVAEGRPCGDGEDPKKGKCNDGTAPPPKQQKPTTRGLPPKKKHVPLDPTGQPGRPVSDDPRMTKGPAKEGVGLQPSKDAGREARMAQHVDFLSQDDGTDTKQTTNLMRNMMGGAAPQPQPDGSSLVGSPAATPQEAKQQNDDFRDTLSKTGWETHSEMGNKAVYKKGNTAIVLEKKNNGNQMKIKNLRPPAAPQRGRR